MNQESREARKLCDTKEKRHNTCYLKSWGDSMVDIMVVDGGCGGFFSEGI